MNTQCELCDGHDPECPCRGHRLEYQCPQCAGVGSMWSRYEPPVAPDICETCRHANAAAELPDSLWVEIDPLVIANSKLVAIKQIKDHCECPLHDALGIFVDRYRHLRKTVPSKFRETDDEYWAGFES